MAAAYTRRLPGLEVVSLTGPLALLRNSHVDVAHMFGLSRPLKLRYLPLLCRQREQVFDQDYRPPKWFYRVIGHYARIRCADLVFTRKPETAMVTTRAGLDTVLETHVPWEERPWRGVSSEMLRSPKLRALVVISQPLADSILGAGALPEKVLVEPDGVDINQFDPPMDKVIARENLGLCLGESLCVYSGHLHSGRGIDEILEAARVLSNVHFLFLGGWDRDVKYYRGVARSQALTNVTFRGYVPHTEVPLYLFASDILLMPYNASLHTAKRCSPLKLFEYMAAGRPIISSDLPSLRTVLRHKMNAFLIRPDSVIDLIEAIRYILASRGLTESLSKNARRASMKYSWDERASRILDHALGNI